MSVQAADPVRAERRRERRLRRLGSAPYPALLLHYHLFKNAGTSVDRMLRRNFGQRWHSAEFSPPRQGRSNEAEVGAYLAQRPHLQALSSHTALLPAPAVEGRTVIPVIFVRHPIDRLRSAYAFERMQEADTLGAQLAKAHDFASYVRALLERPGHRQARNFHTHRLAFAFPGEAGSELERALMAVHELPFVGLVEAYPASIRRLAAILGEAIPGFRTVLLRANSGEAAHLPLEARLEAVRASLPPDLFDELMAANADDLGLHQAVQALYPGGTA